MNIGPGSILGGYRIERALGSGGMGTVYLAQHPVLPRRDALKVLWPHLATDPEFRARFDREANLAATLDHPNIVAVHNKGEDQGCLWIALQYVPGLDAASAQEQDRVAMTADRVVRIITEIGHGLDHAHRAGLLHRDIKPANFLLAPQQHGPERVLLADFGIAKPADGATELTRTGTFMATVAYASPEQLSGERIDARSDIYSLACSFYRLLTGQTPYPGTQPLNVMMGHLNEPPPRITALRPDLPAALDGVFARALAKDPGRRFGSCLELTEAAAGALGGWTARRAPTVLNSTPAMPAQPASGSPFARLKAEADVDRARREGARREAELRERREAERREAERAAKVKWTPPSPAAPMAPVDRQGVQSFASLAAERAHGRERPAQEEWSLDAMRAQARQEMAAGRRPRAEDLAPGRSWDVRSAVLAIRLGIIALLALCTLLIMLFH
ncbi:serine/threonine-protein kinase [Nocardia sp. NPDC059240]|uniref:serine/threonine-protein kinase n=1 Tax=Nocardia sp. NPDC059240 TaxID=3346786 RepID=UPI00369C35CA